MKLKKVTKVNKEKKPNLNLKNNFFSRATRAVLHDCQIEFDVNADRAYYLFFQKFLGEYAKYECPKILSVNHRSSNVFKVTELYSCMKLRYMAWRCSVCGHYYTRFNTTKPFEEWESGTLPKLATRFLEKEGHIICTDCIFVVEVFVVE